MPPTRSRRSVFADGAEFGSFHDGDVVQREDFEPRYAQFPGPARRVGAGGVRDRERIQPAIRLRVLVLCREQGPGDRRVPGDGDRPVLRHRAQIARITLALAEEYEKEPGHAPDQWALATTRQFAYAMSCRCKGAGVLDFARLLCEWEQSSRGAELGTLRDLARTVLYAVPGGGADARVVLARMATRLVSRRMLMLTQECAAMAAPLAQTHESRAA